jgi:ADP-ribosylglycohydrolase
MTDQWDDFLSSVKPGDSVDKIIGMIYGHALGDAVGLVTEFKFKRDRVKVEFPYTTPIRDFPLCDWTDDTDHLILVMRSLVENEFRLEPKDIAAKLKEWVSTGFKELGDTRGIGLGGTMSMVISHPKFLEDPLISSSTIWHNSGKKLAANGSLMRTSIIGAIPNPELCESFATQLSMITHVDPRCVTSCVLQSLVIGGLIHGNLTAAEDVDQLLTDAVSSARRYITVDSEPAIFEEMRHQPTPKAYHDPTFKSRDEELSYWVELAYTKSISELHLDDMVKFGYVFKCLGCSIYALQVIRTAVKHSLKPSFKKFVVRIAEECGDADTNAAVAGATLGAYLGYSQLPTDWIKALPNREWLNEHIMQFITSCKKKFTRPEEPVVALELPEPLVEDPFVL